MLILILSAAFLGCAHAQFYTSCECAIYSESQVGQDGAIPLEYRAVSGINANECDKGVDVINGCSQACQQIFDSEGGNNVDLCDSSEDVPRCRGSRWCESLFNSGFPTIPSPGEGLRLFYRMRDCTGEFHVDWTYAQRNMRGQQICCTDGLFDHCTAPCDDCVVQNLCECGIFIDEQFERSAAPMPLQYLNEQWGVPEPITCNNWPAPNFQGTCDAFCRLASQFYKGNVSLDDASNYNADMSYGEFYCQALYNRWTNDNIGWPENGIGPQTMVAHARMPGCERPDGTHVLWLRDRVYSCHHQDLCCDGDGHWKWCPIGSDDDDI